MISPCKSSSTMRATQVVGPPILLRASQPKTHVVHTKLLRSDLSVEIAPFGRPRIAFQFVAVPCDNASAARKNEGIS